MARMTIKEAAEALGLSAQTIRNQVTAGRLAATKHGRDWWLTPAEVERYRRESLSRPGRHRKRA